MTLQQTLEKIEPASETARAAAHAHQQAQAKPLGGLGLLEEAVECIAAAQHTAAVDIGKRAVVVFCADNGVVAQGVTQCGQEVTAVVAENLSRGRTSVCIMARQANMDVIPVDIGVARPVVGEHIVQRNLMCGTDDITRGPAMTRETCVRALETGITLAADCAERGYRLLATGEMGIGNTTTSAAVTAALLGLSPETVTGRGAGLTSEGLHRKIEAVRTALAVNRPDPADALDVLAKVGGLDIAGMAGLVLGGALCHVPVVLDGLISTVAALAAVRLCPAAGGYVLVSHVSAEPAGKLVLDALGLKPIICAGMHLGEGTGAVAGVSLFDHAVAVYREMPCFEALDLDPYVPLT